MRSTRGILLLAIAIIVAGVGGTYYYQKRTQARQAPPPPPKLPVDVGAAASKWTWSRNVEGRPIVEIDAENFRQVQTPDRIELQKVELRLFHKDGRQFDRVKSAHALFDPAQSTLYSDGDVEITMGMPVEGPPGRLIFIRTSGVTFDSKTGRAATDRIARFAFDQGQGKAVGASYDPSSRELQMRSEVDLEWRGRGPNSRTMRIQSGELIYKEADSIVMLFPWSRLVRDNTLLEAADSLVILEEGAIRNVEAKKAHGTDRYPGRQLQYEADQLWMTFTPEGQIEKLTGEGNARLVSTAETASTTVRTHRIDLEFEPGAGDSPLKKALARGDSVVESAPAARAGAQLPETRILRSDTIQMDMRAGGREMEQVRTESPGELEFLPNQPGQRRRLLKGERISIAYGPDNRIQSFRSVNVATRTDPPAKPPGPPLETWSKDLSAEFDARGGLATLEQWNDFRYQEGGRQGRAQRAVLEQTRGAIRLEEAARVWDETGSTSADRILLDQKTGDMTAVGKVVSSRLPDRKGKSSAMLSNEESTEARADRMTTSEGRQKVRYEGHAVMWQGANRIQADTIDIDRKGRRLMADRNVVTQFVDRPAAKDPKAAAKPAKAPEFVIVRAARLVYTEADRLAHYTGGAQLSRTGMEVKAGEIRAYLRDADADSSLDHAYADGRVQIVHTEPGRTRQAAAEHAEYYVAGERVLLRGGSPTLIDSVGGRTSGEELTYFAHDDRLLVVGVENHPVKSRIRRKN